MKDFFISYNKADRHWAEWTAWHLEEKGYTTILQAWDFRPASNFVVEMQHASVEAERTIAILSPDYLTALYTLPEWAAAFAKDPTGEAGTFLPVRVRECELSGLLSQVVYVDLVGMPETAAKQSLLAGVLRARAKPPTAPAFPGSAHHTVGKPKRYPGSPVLFRGRANDSLSIITRRIISTGIYVAAVAALFWGISKLQNPFERLLGDYGRWLAIGISCLPIVATVAFDTVPAWVRRRRRRRLIDEGIHGKLVEPGYFRIHPYVDTDQDRKSYSRADKAHETIFTWLRDANEPVSYLTGRSGTGKSSLLNAFVLPELRRHSPRQRQLLVRSFHDPISALQKSLLELNTAGGHPPAEVRNTRELLERACRDIFPDQLLIVFDQFEEFLIIFDRALEPLREVESFLRSVSQEPIANLRILLVIRSDYIGKLQELDLPLMRQNQNWKEIYPFTEQAARDFLAGSGFSIGSRLMARIINQAAEMEETRGLIRPITLNMIGMVLERISNSEQVLRKSQEVSGLLIRYVRDSINISDIRDYSHQVLRRMITPAGTKLPKSVEELADETKLNKNVISGCLLILSNSGITRVIEEKSNIWEIAHDFVARLLSHVISSEKKTWVQRARPWFVPATLALWAVFFLLVLPAYFQREHAKVVSIIEEKASIMNAKGGLRVEFDKDATGLAGALDQLKYLDGLKELDLSLTKITEAELDYLKQLPDLPYLDLGDTHLSDSGLAKLTGLTNLEHLDLESGLITDQGVTHIKSLPKLKWLDLSYTKISSEGLRHVSETTTLINLDIAYTNISDDGLKYLGELTNLETLELKNTRIDGSGLGHLRKLSKLHHLGCDKTRINDSGLQTLPALGGLKRLYLDDTLISGNGLTHLTSLAGLTRLDLNRVSLGDEGLGNMQHLKGLTHLDLEDAKITSGGLEHLRALPDLQWLDLSRNEISNDGLRHLEPLKKLETLHLSRTKIDGSGLEHLRGLGALKELNICFTSVVDAGTEHLVALKNLTSVCLENDQVTDRSLDHVRNLRNLKTITLSGTNVTKQGIEMLQKELPQLTIK